ncbi:MAG: dimethyl sulfoxide reductase anchor subunit [Pseudomonadota bacterium]|nr:dimethyl sulfoxide reductase anchor subunit [Pseudomonadota bacterium]
MKPSFAVIFFTTVSGAGYGMLFWLGVLGAAGQLPRTAWFGVLAIAVAATLFSAGLGASTFHLGRPERAWRAISQWRSSWLSREGVASLVAYVPAGLFALFWALSGGRAGTTVAFGLLSALAAVVTVVCTAMIYRSLLPVRQWHNGYVLPNYLLLASFSGAACLAAMASFWQIGPARIAAALAILSGLAGVVGKLAYWRFIDRPSQGSTIESATGLGGLGPVRMLESPNIEENYLLREMGFRIGRKHAGRLRVIAVGVGFAAPILLLIVGTAAGGAIARILLPVAAASAMLGLYIERWLFFAEATHTVTLYYGQPV